MPIRKKEVIQFLAGQLKKQDFLNIKAKTKSYPDPKGIFWEKGEKASIPDLTAEKGEKMGVFSIVENTSKIPSSELSKFKLFSAYASQRNGKHFMVVESGSAPQLHSVVKKYGILAEILPIERSQPA